VDDERGASGTFFGVLLMGSSGFSVGKERRAFDRSL